MSSNSTLSPLIYDNIDFLKTLAKTKSVNKRKKILHKATTSQLLSLVEISLNILKSRFRLTTRQKNRILPYADFVRKLSRARSERGAKNLVQKGGSLSVYPALLTPIILEVAKKLLINENGDK